MGTERVSYYRRKPGETTILDKYPIPDKSTLKLALESGYSLQFDDLPENFEIRIMDRRSPPPPLPPPVQLELSPRSNWMDDYGPLRWDNEGRGVDSSPVSLPPSPSRSREKMEDSLRRDMLENYGAVNSCEKCRAGEEDIFLRKPSRSDTPAKERPTQPPPSTPAPPPPSFIDGKRKNSTFRRNNIKVDESHPNEVHSSSEEPHIRTPPPSPQRMPPQEEYDPSRYESKSPPPSDPAGRCSYHKSSSCPVLAGSRCRNNLGSESSEADSRADASPELQPQPLPEPRCKYHRGVPCPALAGVSCRGERSMSPPTARPCHCKEEQAKPQQQLEPPQSPNPDLGGAPIKPCKCRQAAQSVEQHSARSQSPKMTARFPCSCNHP